VNESASARRDQLHGGGASPESLPVWFIRSVLRAVCVRCVRLSRQAKPPWRTQTNPSPMQGNARGKEAVCRHREQVVALTQTYAPTPRCTVTRTRLSRSMWLKMSVLNAEPTQRQATGCTHQDIRSRRNLLLSGRLGRDVQATRKQAGADDKKLEHGGRRTTQLLRPLPRGGYACAERAAARTEERRTRRSKAASKK